MNVMVHAEGARVVVRDVLRRPLAELELGEVHGVLRRLTPTVMQACCMPAAPAGGAPLASFDHAASDGDVVLLRLRSPHRSPLHCSRSPIGPSWQVPLETAP